MNPSLAPLVHRLSFPPVDGGWQARNPGQQGTTKFDQRARHAGPSLCHGSFSTHPQSPISNL